jgi:ComF family protein
MKARDLASGLARGLLGMGRDCVLCGGESEHELLCRACLSELPVLPACCPQCALPSPAAGTCGSCLRDSPHFDSTKALWRYEFPCDKLVQALKYGSRLALAGFFARCLASQTLPEVDLVVPMPIHPRRLSERGFNPALEIARGIARLADRPITFHGALRVRHSPPQTGLRYEERAGNVRGAFECHIDLRGKRVGVVDDVMTTGSTLNELARALKRAGALRVENFVVARTVPR